MDNRECHHYLLSKIFIGSSFFGSFLCIWFREIIKKKTYFLVLPTQFWPTNLPGPPYRAKKKIVLFIGFMVLKMTGLSSRFQRKKRFWKIWIESRDVDQNVTKFRSPNQIFNIWDSVHIFQNKFLRWNRELKLVVLSTMKPRNRFFLAL